MFGKLPDLLDRNFAIGFFLPGAMLIGAIALVLSAYGRLPGWLTFETVDAFTNAAIVAGISWLVAIGLMAINRPVIRFLEGYPYKDLPLLGGLTRRWKRRFTEKAVPTIDFQERIDNARRVGQPLPTRPPGHSEKLWKIVDRYPAAESQVLPTRFGNQYRAIEVYSMAVYGLDAIPAWPRLEAIMSSEMRSRIADANAQLNFAVNTLLVGAAATVLYVVMALDHGGPLREPWIAVAAVVLGVFGYLAALTALRQFGTYVRSTFDLYREDLAAALGLELPRSPDAEREMWHDVSRLMVYRSAAAWDRLTKFRKPGGREIG